MNESNLFRTPEQELSKLIDEIQQARIAVQDASKKLTQIESRIRRTFPSLPKLTTQSSKKGNGSQTLKFDSNTSINDALRLFDDLVDLARTQSIESVANKLDSFDSDYLNELRKNLGLSLGKNKPTRERVKNLLIGRVNQSVQLTIHTNRRDLIEKSN